MDNLAIVIGEILESESITAVMQDHGFIVLSHNEFLEEKHYLGDPPEFQLQGLAKYMEPISSGQAIPGFRQSKGDKPIQHGPAKRRKW